MRTTISIDDSLLERARAESLRTGSTLGEVIEEALRLALVSQSKAIRERRFVPLKTFRGTGLQPGVDLDSSSGLLEVMEQP